jgi:hypothetical protein
MLVVSTRWANIRMHWTRDYAPITLEHHRARASDAQRWPYLTLTKREHRI